MIPRKRELAMIPKVQECHEKSPISTCMYLNPSAAEQGIPLPLNMVLPCFQKGPLKLLNIQMPWLPEVHLNWDECLTMQRVCGMQDLIILAIVNFGSFQIMSRVSLCADVVRFLSGEDRTGARVIPSEEVSRSQHAPRPRNQPSNRTDTKQAKQKAYAA
jgi:hypothetical protein